MVLLLAGFIALVMVATTLLHGYWAAGGRGGLAEALPAHAGGAVVFRPSRAAVVVVAGGLLVLAGVAAAHLLPGRLGLPAGWLRTADWGLAVLFGLRGVGDFKFVGLTKRVRATIFAHLDTRYYTPLCLLLAASWAGLARLAG